MHYGVKVITMGHKPAVLDNTGLRLMEGDYPVGCGGVHSTVLHYTREEADALRQALNHEYGHKDADRIDQLEGSLHEIHGQIRSAIDLIETRAAFVMVAENLREALKIVERETGPRV